MDETRGISPLANQATRRTLLKRLAAAPVLGAALAVCATCAFSLRLPGGAIALADTTGKSVDGPQVAPKPSRARNSLATPGLQLVQNKSVDGPQVAPKTSTGRKLLATPGLQLVKAFSGLADFHTLVSGNAWTFSGAFGLRPTNALDCYSTDRLDVGNGSVLLAVGFYVLNSGPSVSNCLLVRADPITSTFANHIFNSPAPNTGGIQEVDLDLGDGVVIDDATYSTTLVWCPAVGDGTNILYGAQIVYLTGSA